MIKPITFRETDTLQTALNSSIINIEKATENNSSRSKTIWTGKKLSIKVMSIPIGGDSGNLVNEDIEQFIKIENGRAKIFLGDNSENYSYERIIDDDYAVVIPSGIWYKIINSGNEVLKMYSITSGSINSSN